MADKEKKIELTKKELTKNEKKGKNNIPMKQLKRRIPKGVKDGD